MQGQLILASRRGDKTQTRRERGLKEINKNPDNWGVDQYAFRYGKFGVWFRWAPTSSTADVAASSQMPIFIPCPWGGPGDLIWMRETWRPKVLQSCDYSDLSIDYKADGGRIYFSENDIPEKWMLPKAAKSEKNVSPLFMPRWASRITGLLIDVRVERVNQISREDAIAEGISRVGGGKLRWENWSGKEGQSGFTPQAAFALLYESINGPGSFDNRWNWVLTYKTIAANVDGVISGDLAV